MIVNFNFNKFNGIYEKNNNFHFTKHYFVDVFADRLFNVIE